MPVLGYKELQKQLRELGSFAGGKALRNAAMFAIKPAKDRAKAMIPKGKPPYQYSDLEGDNFRSVDPYPRKTHKGRLVTPGFSSRQIATRSRLSRDKTSVSVSLGVRSEAYQVLQFVELGTSKIPKRPWLEPAFRSSISAVNERFRRRLKANIDKARF